MKKIVRLTERDLTRLVKRVIIEQPEEELEKANDVFFTTFEEVKNMYDENEYACDGDLPNSLGKIEISSKDKYGFTVKIDGVIYKYKMESQETSRNIFRGL